MKELHHHTGIARSLFGWSPDEKPLRETSWLDGLRGTAAFLVLINHWSTQWTSHFWSAPFGSEVLDNINPDHGIYIRPKGEVLWGFWRLPVLRLVSSAPAHVCLFYVLSGFVLSWAPVALVHAEDYERLHYALGSSVIRRWFRLYLAGAIVSIAYLAHRFLFDNYTNATFLGLIWDYIYNTEKWANPFDMEHVTPFSTNHVYNFVLWTIPFEFSGSMFVFVTLLSLGRIRNFQRRISVIVFISFYAALKLRWDYWLFGSGLALADYVRHNGGFRKLSLSVDPQFHQMCVVMLVFGVLLMGWVGPMPWYSNPGYSWSASLPLPEGARDKLGEGILIWGLGSIMVVTSACHLSFVREVFEQPVPQYLGRISFMLYLIHMLVSNAIALPFRTFVYDTFCTREFDKIYDAEVYHAQPLFHIAVYFLLWAICLPITLMLSHYLEVHIDRPCLALGRWVDSWLLDDRVGGHHCWQSSVSSARANGRIESSWCQQSLCRHQIACGKPQPMLVGQYKATEDGI